MKASNYLEDMILNYFFRNQSVNQPTQLYLALYITNPTDNDSGSEVVGGGYKRQLIAFDVPSQAGEKGTITNNARIEFPKAQASWGDVAYFGIRTSLSGGNLLCYGTFNKPVAISDGDQFVIEQGNLSVAVG
ncbi:MAG: phage tail fiber protein [Peptoniphilaceae bacterium]